MATPAREIWYVFLFYSTVFFSCVFGLALSSGKAHQIFCCIYAFRLSSGDVVVLGCLSQFRLARGAQNCRVEKKKQSRTPASALCFSIDSIWSEYIRDARGAALARHKQINVNHSANSPKALPLRLIAGGNRQTSVYKLGNGHFSQS